MDEDEYSRHEILDRTALIRSTFQEWVLDAPACQADPEFKELAERSWAALEALYQKIGSKHL